MNDIGEELHVLKNPHRRYVVGASDNILYEVSIWTGPRSVLSFILHKSIFIHFIHHGTKIYEKYINNDDREKKLMMMGVVFNQNRRI